MVKLRICNLRKINNNKSRMMRILIKDLEKWESRTRTRLIKDKIVIKKIMARTIRNKICNLRRIRKGDKMTK